MNYKIVDVEGIGAVYAEKLIAAGIKSTDALLEKCAKPAGRKELAEATGISPKLILTWANHTDLMRINGVGPQFAELLEAAGVDTVKEFRRPLRPWLCCQGREALAWKYNNPERGRCRDGLQF